MDKKKVNAVILASGTGSRFQSEVPKQFHKIDGKTLVEICCDKFMQVKEINKIIVVTNQNRINQISKNLPSGVVVIAGGKTRNESLLAGCNYDLDAYVISHDAARPYVDVETIKKHCEWLNKYDCVCTGIKAVDTLLRANGDGTYEYVNRDEILHMQTPQSFSAKEFIDNYKDIYTDASGLFLELGKSIYVVDGSSTNKKITYKKDLLV